MFDSSSGEYIDGIDKLLSKPVVATKLIGAVEKFPGDGQTASSAVQS